MTQKSIYDLGLHETIYTDKGSAAIIRVNGGWLYFSYIYNNDTCAHSTSTFVPYSEEFLPEKKDKRPLSDHFAFFRSTMCKECGLHGGDHDGCCSKFTFD